MELYNVCARGGRKGGQREIEKKMAFGHALAWIPSRHVNYVAQGGEKRDVYIYILSCTDPSMTQSASRFCNSRCRVLSISPIINKYIYTFFYTASSLLHVHRKLNSLSLSRVSYPSTQNRCTYIFLLPIIYACIRGDPSYTRGLHTYTPALASLSSCIYIYMYTR